MGIFACPSCPLQYSSKRLFCCHHLCPACTVAIAMYFCCKRRRTWRGLRVPCLVSRNPPQYREGASFPLPFLCSTQKCFILTSAVSPPKDWCELDAWQRSISGGGRRLCGWMLPRIQPSGQTVPFKAACLRKGRAEVGSKLCRVGLRSLSKGMRPSGPRSSCESGTNGSCQRRFWGGPGGGLLGSLMPP